MTTTTAVDTKVFEALRARLRGPLVLPGADGYDAARAIWNGTIDRKPAAIVRCLGVGDVAAGIDFAREQGLAISVKGGGHNISGLAVADGALMLDMSLMRGVWVDRQAKRVHAQAGCLLGDVDRETQLHGLATVLGFVSNTGIAGLTLGGGFGYLTPRFGWTSDNVVSMDVVTAEGRIVRASDSENPDLFWGLRGGGGNFGVVTSFEYRLYEVGPEIMAGAIAWPASEAPGVFELFKSVQAEANPEMACVLGLRKAPPAPWLAPEIHGKDIVALFICHSGTLADGEKAVQRIKAFGKPVGDIVQPRTYTSQQSLLDATQPSGRRYYWKSEYLSGHETEMLKAAANHAARMPSPHSAILFFPLAGALNKLGAGHSPVGNRDAASVFNIAASWEQPGADAENIEWARETWRDLRRFSTGGTYVNFLTEEETGDRLRDAYGGHFDRLVQVKSKWDPTNFFKLNKNIAPARP